VSNPQEWKRVRPRIKNLVGEAKAILKEYKFPTSSAALMKYKKEPPDRLALEAELVVHAEYYLQQAIEQNKADAAAKRMFDLLSAYLSMADLRDVPETEDWMKLGRDENEVLNRGLRAGLKNLLRNKDKAIPSHVREAIQKRAYVLREEKPEAYIYTIQDLLADEYEVSKRYIIENIKISKKTSKKKK